MRTPPPPVHGRGIFYEKERIFIVFCCNTKYNYNMEWDEAKNQTNIKKHGISFELAKHVFDDPNAIEYYDKEHSTMDEQRYICIGDVGGFLIVFVVYEDKQGNIRLISARQAEQKEKEAYYEHIRRAIGNS